MQDDDDELHGLSYSDTRREASADHGKMEALKREIKAKTGDASNVAKVERKSLGKLIELKREVAGKEAQSNQAAAQQEKTSGAAKTKTHREQEQATVATAQDNPDTDTMLDRQANAQPVSGEEIQSEPG